MPRTAAAHALATPHWTVTTKTVHQLPQLGRVCQSPLAHLHCIVTFRSQPCVFLREPDHIHPKARRLRLCLNYCFLQYIHLAVQVLNLLLGPSFSLPMCAMWASWDPGLGFRPCWTAALAIEDTWRRGHQPCAGQGSQEPPGLPGPHFAHAPACSVYVVRALYRAVHCPLHPRSSHTRGRPNTPIPTLA